MAAGGRPCMGPWLWAATLASGLPTGRLYIPKILDPDGEDEEGQASSSLAISTRWMVAAILLQSQLKTRNSCAPSHNTRGRRSHIFFAALLQ
ncbi:hypothetical protein GW17_00046485 [Ensete ventricosum]|nr:hypothetical protein GW17_00046485 [Ensete ventricosum]